MNNILEELFNNYTDLTEQKESISQLTLEIENNKKWLKRNLNKRQKKLLLRIEDGKDLSSEIISKESFISGFKLGLKIGYEVNKEQKL